MNNEQKQALKNSKMLEQEKRLIEQEISKTQREMAVALNQFETAIEPDLIDYYTYVYKASMAKYDYLIKSLRALYNSKASRNK